MKPAAILSVTDRTRFKELALEQSVAVTPGRLLWCRGRKVLGYADVEQLGNTFKIPKGADTIVLSIADFDDVRAWLG